jgi:branched-chain amino acid transport system permease protein
MQGESFNVRIAKLWFIPIIVLLIFVPYYFPGYILSFLLFTFMMIALAQSWNMISGLTGYVSFGHTAFFGIGAYTSTLLLKNGIPWYLAAFHGGIIALLVALPLGTITLRIRGPYFAITMLGLNEITRVIALLWVDLTRGGDGIALNPENLPGTTIIYYAMLLIAILSSIMIYRVLKGRFGLELLAIREDEEAAEMVGVNSVKNKILAFLMSAFFPGVVGGLYAFYVSFIDPPSVFSPAMNLQIIAMVLLGGSGTLWGPVIGASLLSILREILWARFPFYHMALLGIVIIVVILFLPRGVLSFFEREGAPERSETREGENA